MPRFSQLSDWLTWLEGLHPKEIDLGLARVYEVACRLNLLKPTPGCDHTYSGTLHFHSAAQNTVQNGFDHGERHVFTVAGTNGKGSCVATIEQCLLAQNATVGTYTSPHLYQYSERIRVNGQPVDDSLICDAFAAIDDAREDISLTYFEFSTLAALWIFVQRNVQYTVLEVGLGGRLDAVNIVDADIAIITSIAIDHEEWLGSDREKIALEKLGVARQHAPVIIAETDLTQSMETFACQHNSVSIINRDFFISPCADKQHWQWQASASEALISLPIPSLPLTSVAAALQALHVSGQLSADSNLSLIVKQLMLQGRYQVEQLRGRFVILDVAHNPAASALLANKLSANVLLKQPDVETELDNSGSCPRTWAVFAVMDDKDIAGIVEPMSHVVDHWYSSELEGNPRSASSLKLSHILQSQHQVLTSCNNIQSAFDLALKNSAEHDRIVVFGSFFTVAAIEQHISTCYR